ncbi:thymidine kinase [Maritimibacter fusiformis]|uniref:Thymidine kinase n=1 Tax=Maritimibacter fusiformis TaxID=2603819 RepID=A0A5D0RNK7_9RHOB|nr:thymidine kinase [Maritimibacter fusiformis]TYB82164.1 thymidine kinase [Maritimibacter fusiformis]
MAKLHFIYATMGAGKSSLLIQTEWNYRERDMRCLLLTAAFDHRDGHRKISSRIGLKVDAETFEPGQSLMETHLRKAADDGINCVLVDEAQFLTRPQVEELAVAVDDFNLPVMCYGLRTDFRGQLFEGSAALLALADEFREARTICKCGRKATMVYRTGAGGVAVFDGDQVEIGGNERYVPVCRKHWREATRPARAGGGDKLA